MNWVQQNKFLTGFIAAMVIGIGVLGFKVFSASGALEEEDAKYNNKATAYNRLRNLEPFPSKKNLDAFEVQKAEATQAINAFQEELAKREFPVEPMSPEQFQDRLKKSVTDVRALAATAGVKLPDKFYLGFDRYETAPPDKDAATALGRQLKAVEWILQQFIAARIVELKELKRPELPEEKGKTGGAPANRPGDRGPRTGSDRGDRGDRGGRPGLVTETPFDIVVVGKQRQFADVLNTIVSPKAPQFYIPRSLRVANQNPKGPSRAVETPPPAPPVDPSAPPVAEPPTATPPPVASDISYIVGEELIEVALRLEVVDFAEVAKK